LNVEPVADPAGGVRIAIAAPTNTHVVLGDEASTIDSMRVASLGASVLVPIASGTITAIANGQRVAASAPRAIMPRAIVVVGSAAWEGKFIASALEERGWHVDAHFSVAPNVDVTQNWPPSIDTNRVAAVIAVDSSVRLPSTQIEDFVRSGGGLVLVGSAAASGLASLAPGALGVRTRAQLPLPDTLSLGATGFYPVTRLNPDAVPIARRHDGLVVAARRIGAGRVLQIGYDDSWRWRMAGGDGAVRAHRAWWSNIVASVAYTPHDSGTTAFHVADNAPLVNLVDKLGDASDVQTTSTSRTIDPRLWLVLIVILLVAEWTSRRTRGLR
jgi:hypothetical protein